MLFSLNDARGYGIAASDGSLGKATDFFFEDRQWTIRYLVVDTGWLFGRKALIAPDSIVDVDSAKSEISLSLSQNEIEEAPGVGTDLPVSRQEEIAINEHYGWPNYWEVYPAGVGVAPLIPAMEPRSSAGSIAGSSVEADARERGDPHLRSSREVEGYHIEAKDGEIGHVEDFIVDDDTWCIRYIAVDTRNWLPGRKVLVSPSWATGIDWAGRLVRLEMNREEIKNSPPYDPSVPIGRDYENALHEHLGQRAYWT